MKISLEWLNDYVDLSNIKPDEIAERLTMSSAEVESAEWTGGNFGAVKAARIDKVDAHPNSDKLHLATIFDGEVSATVVCGAPNIAEGQVVPYAPLGTILPGNFEIKPAVIRGVESRGMLCSSKELGIGEDHSGILQLDRDVKPGTLLADLLGKPDFVIEIENKTINHRPDLWGHYGIARELRTVFKLPWKKKLEYKGIKADNALEKFNIVMDTPKALHYVAVKLSGISVCASPEWLKRRLESVGLRSINNIVDITNFVMLETGHPLHAFDRRHFSGNTVTVRMAADGEKFTTLDGVERTLNASDILICDGKGAVALAGVMGGLNSEVKPDTTELVLESALFDPAAVRRTANRLDLRTDAASRFEKAMWPENSYLAAERFIELVKEIVPGAKVSSEIATADATANYGFKGTIRVNPERIRNALGVTIEQLPDERIGEILEYLEFTIQKTAGDWEIAAPAHRRSKDISIEADIFEEIGRIYGFDNITPAPPLFPMLPAPVRPELTKERNIRAMLKNRFSGYELINYSFAGDKETELFPVQKDKLVTIRESKDRPYLKYSMAPDMLEKVYLNQKNFDSFTLFEFARIFGRDGEKKRLAVAVYGETEPFAKMKEIATAIMEEFSAPNYRFERAAQDEAMFHSSILLHPGKSAVLSAIGKKTAILGEIHPKMTANYDIKGRVGYLEIDWEKASTLPVKTDKFKPINRFPSTFYEITVVVEVKTEVEDLLNIIRKSADKTLLADCGIVGRYIGAPIPEGFQSLSFRVTLNGGGRTLTVEELNAAQDKTAGELRRKGYRLKGD